MDLWFTTPAELVGYASVETIPGYAGMTGSGRGKMSFVLVRMYQVIFEFRYQVPVVIIVKHFPCFDSNYTCLY